MKSAFIVAGLAGAILFGGVPQEARAASFAGKTIRVVINFPSGGPTDIFMRQLAPFIAKRMPGQPSMVIENRPGAGGLIGANYLYNNASPDGLTLGFMTSIALQALAGSPQAKYDLEGFKWVATVPQTQVLVGRKDLGIVEPLDFRKPKTPLVYGSSGAGEAGTVLTKLFYRMAKVDVKYVVGYRGQAESDLALVRGEINNADMGLTTFISQKGKIQEEGVVTGLLQRGVYQPDGSFKRHPLIPDLKTMPEALEQLDPSAKDSVEFGAYAVTAGAFGVHFAFLLPPKTSEDIVSTFRSAVYEALDDPDTRKSVREKLLLEYDLLSGQEAENVISGLRKTLSEKPKVKDLIAKMIAE